MIIIASDAVLDAPFDRVCADLAAIWKKLV